MVSRKQGGVFIMGKHHIDQHELQMLADHEFSHRFNHTLHAYIDIAGDLVAGTLLSQIIYWFTPNSNGQQKVRVFKDGHYWLAKKQEEWYDEIRITEKQYRTAIKKLEDKKLVIKKRYKFNGSPTTHIRPNYPILQEEIEKWKHAVMKEIEEKNTAENPILTKGKKPVKSSVSEDKQDEKSSNSAESLVFDQRSKWKFTKGQNGNLPSGKNINRDYNKDYNKQTNGDCLIDSSTEKDADDFLHHAMKKGMNIKSVQATRQRYLEARKKGIKHETLINSLDEAHQRYGENTSPISVIQSLIANRIAEEEAEKAAMAEAEEKERKRKQNAERLAKAMIAVGLEGEINNA
jgi:hypothetical protein